MASTPSRIGIFASVLGLFAMAGAAGAQDRDAQRARLHQQLARATTDQTAQSQPAGGSLASRVRANAAAQALSRSQNLKVRYPDYHHGHRDHGSYDRHRKPHHDPSWYRQHHSYKDYSHRSGTRVNIVIGGHYGYRSHGGFFYNGCYIPPRIYTPYTRVWNRTTWYGPTYPGSSLIVHGGYPSYPQYPVVNDLGPIDPQVTVAPVGPMVYPERQPGIDFGDPQGTPLDTLERARWHLAQGRPGEAIDEYRMHLHAADAPQQAEARREFGVALLENGGLEEGVSVIASAYRLHPELADGPLVPAVLGRNAEDRLADLIIEVGRLANRTGNPDAWLTAAVLIAAQDRPHRAITPLERAEASGLDPTLADRLRAGFERQLGVNQGP